MATAFGFDAVEGTDAEMLILVREAIATVAASGQSYKIRNREYTAANLKELQGLEMYYSNKVRTANTGLAKNYVRPNRRIPNTTNGIGT